MANDLISRQAAATIPVLLKEHRKYQTCNLDDAYEQGWFDLQKCIEDLPSAQPERKKGKWKRRLVDSGYNVDWYCSVCKWKTSLEQHGYNYCPNCGADMRGEEE